MKAYYLTIIGVVLLIVSFIVKTDKLYFDTFDTYIITERTFLLQIAAMFFLLIAFMIKLVNFIRQFK